MEGNASEEYFVYYRSLWKHDEEASLRTDATEGNLNLIQKFLCGLRPHIMNTCISLLRFHLECTHSKCQQWWRADVTWENGTCRYFILPHFNQRSTMPSFNFRSVTSTVVCKETLGCGSKILKFLFLVSFKSLFLNNFQVMFYNYEWCIDTVVSALIYK